MEGLKLIKGRQATGKLVAGLEASEAADNREVSRRVGGGQREVCGRVGGDKGRWATGKFVEGLEVTRGGGQQGNLWKGWR